MGMSFGERLVFLPYFMSPFLKIDFKPMIFIVL